MSLERFVNMFTTTVPDATAEEIADALWLAAGFPADPISSPGDLPRPSRHGRPEARRPEDLAPAYEISAARRPDLGRPSSTKRPRRRGPLAACGCPRCGRPPSAGSISRLSSTPAHL